MKEFIQDIFLRATMLWYHGWIFHGELFSIYKRLIRSGVFTPHTHPDSTKFSFNLDNTPYYFHVFTTRFYIDHSLGQHIVLSKLIDDKSEELTEIRIYWTEGWGTGKLRSFQQVLDDAPEEVATTLLFHLDLFLTPSHEPYMVLGG